MDALLVKLSPLDICAHAYNIKVIITKCAIHGAENNHINCLITETLHYADGMLLVIISTGHR